MFIGNFKQQQHYLKKCLFILIFKSKNNALFLFLKYQYYTYYWNIFYATTNRNIRFYFYKKPKNFAKSLAFGIPQAKTGFFKTCVLSVLGVSQYPLFINRKFTQMAFLAVLGYKRYTQFLKQAKTKPSKAPLA